MSTPHEVLIGRKRNDVKEQFSILNAKDLGFAGYNSLSILVNMEYLDSVWGKSTLTGAFYLNEGDVLDDSWKDGTFSDVQISGGSLACSYFTSCTFKNTTFENIYLDYVDFFRCHFDDFRIVNCAHEGMKMRECTGSPPTLIGTKAPPPDWKNKPLPPGWGPEADQAKQ